MKTTNKHFSIFVKECERCVELLGLQSYEIRYIHRGLTNSRARANIDYGKGLAVISFSSHWDNRVGNPLSTETIKLSAKHEVAHVLIGRLSCIALSRFVTENELTEANEEIVNRLMRVL